MGKVRIISGGTDGLYTVQRVYNERLYQAKKTSLQADMAQYQVTIAGLDAELARVQSSLDDAAGDLALAQEDFITASQAGDDLSGPLRRLGEAQAKMAVIAAERGKIKAQKGVEQIKLTGAEKTASMLDAVAIPPEEQAWCADLTEDATGEVASMEVPGEPQKILLRPQFDTRGIFDSARDGQLMPREWQDSHQAYLNAAILPGWQKSKPTYRIGTVDTLDGDTATVTLDGEVSSAQSLPVDVADAPVTAQVKYMDCNGAAFEVGDRVVVEFTGQSTASPKVIGFADHPKPCFALDAVFYSDWVPGAPKNQPVWFTTMNPSKLVTKRISIAYMPYPEAPYGCTRLPVDRTIDPRGVVLATGVGMAEGSYEHATYGRFIVDDTGTRRAVASRGIDWQYDGMGRLVGFDQNEDSTDLVVLDKSTLQLIRRHIIISSATGYAFDVRANAGQAIVNVWDGSGYKSRIYDVATGSIVHTISHGTVIQGYMLAMGRDYYAVGLWGSSAAFDAHVYRRADHAHVATIPLHSRGASDAVTIGISSNKLAAFYNIGGECVVFDILTGAQDGAFFPLPGLETATFYDIFTYSM